MFEYDYEIPLGHRPRPPKCISEFQNAYPKMHDSLVAFKKCISGQLANCLAIINVEQGVLCWDVTIC